MYDERCKDATHTVYLWTSIDSRERLLRDLSVRKLPNNGTLEFAAEVSGVLRLVNRHDSSEECYGPTDILSSEIHYCLSVGSVWIDRDSLEAGDHKE
jgi:hypothetical protein